MRKRARRDAEAVLDALVRTGPKLQAVKAKPQRLAKWMRKRGWSHRTPRDGLRRRLYSLAIDRHRWWDWGHRLMILTGSDMGGNWSEPEPATWWYRRRPGRPMWRTGYPRSTFQIVTSYDEFTALTEGLNEDQMYEWSALNVNQDGQIQLGHQYWGQGFYGLAADETRLLRRYLRMAHRHDWYGLRSWLYSQGLHAAVHTKKPFTCQRTPPKGTGGYSHWHCREKRGHAGPHRYQSYEWNEAAGAKHVEYAP